jgi:hypothetical protein
MSSISDIQDCLLVAIGRGSPSTARDLLEQFEAAVRADQREKDAVLAEDAGDDNLPGYTSDLPGAVAGFAAALIREAGTP